MDLQHIGFEPEALLASGEMPKSREHYDHLHQAAWLNPNLARPVQSYQLTLEAEGHRPGSLSQDAPQDYLVPILEGMYAGPVRYQTPNGHPDSGGGISRNVAAGAGLLEIGS